MKLSNTFEYETPVDDATTDGLFLERLETFMEKCLADIKAFSERELRPFEETRRFIAQWHAKYLFQSVSSFPGNTALNAERSTSVRNILCDTSRILESLTVTCGVESFLLAVDPRDALDPGFLGGSLHGREFWRGLRSGGENGAKAFKNHCIARLSATTPASPIPTKGTTERHFPTPPPRLGHAKSIKSELYELVRTSLRHCSGVRNAEMKWTNPEKLDGYGVRLIGWPEGIPAQNPSMLKVGQNKALLDAMQSGLMRFERINPINPTPTYEGVGINTAQINTEENEENEDFSWAYDANAHPPSPPSIQPVMMGPPDDTPVAGPSSLAYPYSMESVEVEETFGITDPTHDPSFSPSYEVEFASPDGRDEQMSEMLDPDWMDTFVSDLEPPRKRLRSVEPSPESEDSSNNSDSS